MSSKNILQEYCQKNGLPLPSYTTMIVNDNKTLPVFESSIMFNKVIYLARGSTKIAAEKAVAQEVCQILPNPAKSSPLSICQKYSDLISVPVEIYSRIYLIDGDNCMVTNDETFDDTDSLFIYFVAKNSTKRSVFSHQEKFSNCCVFISDSTNRDATDHLLTFYLGKMSVLWNNKNYYIVTKDHFGECLEKFMENCHFICSI
jgi:hypothetical protein